MGPYAVVGMFLNKARLLVRVPVMNKGIERTSVLFYQDKKDPVGKKILP